MLHSHWQPSSIAVARKALAVTLQSSTPCPLYRGTAMATLSPPAPVSHLQGRDSRATAEVSGPGPGMDMLEPLGGPRLSYDPTRGRRSPVGHGQPVPVPLDIIQRLRAMRLHDPSDKCECQSRSCDGHTAGWHTPWRPGHRTIPTMIPLIRPVIRDSDVSPLADSRGAVGSQLMARTGNAAASTASTRP